MTEEQHILLDLLNGEDKIEFECCNWQGVFELSCRHAVAAMIFDKVKQLYELHGQKLGLSPEMKLQWYSIQSQTENLNRKVNVVLRRVVAVLKKHDINTILLKGQGLANLYGNPLHRHPGDIDLYVGPAKYDEAKNVIAGQGWLDSTDVHEDVKHLSFGLDGVTIELHYYAAILPEPKADMRFQELTSHALTQMSDGFFLNEKGDVDACRGVYIGVLPLCLNAVYTFIHLYRHFIDEGVNLRQLTDWSLLIRRLKASDVEEVRRLLSEFGFLKPWQVFANLLVDGFGVNADEVPCYDGRYKKKARKVLEMILNKGNNHSHLSRHADGLTDKLMALGDIMKNFARVFWLFPKDYLAFTCLLLKSALKKNLKFLH